MYSVGAYRSFGRNRSVSSSSLLPLAFDQQSFWLNVNESMSVDDNESTAHLPIVSGPIAAYRSLSRYVWYWCLQGFWSKSVGQFLIFVVSCFLPAEFGVMAHDGSSSVDEIAHLQGPSLSWNG